MFRMMFLALLVTLSSPALAAPFEFKGIRTGETAAMHLDKFGEFFVLPRGSAAGLNPCRDGSFLIGASAVFTVCNFKDEKLSGADAKLTARFIPGGKLLSISGEFDAPSEIILKAFTAKYGPPTSYGNDRITWRFDDGALVLRKDTFTFSTKKWEQYEREANDALTIKPKVDF